MNIIGCLLLVKSLDIPFGCNNNMVFDSGHCPLVLIEVLPIDGCVCRVLLAKSCHTTARALDCLDGLAERESLRGDGLVHEWWKHGEKV